MSLLDKLSDKIKGNINIGGIAGGDFSINGTFNKLIGGDKIKSQTSGELKALYSESDSPPDLQYPMDLDDSHYILFHVQKRTPHENASVNQPLTRNKTYQTIALPLPVNLQDNRSVNYNNEGLGIVGGMGAAGETGLSNAYNDLTKALSVYGVDAAGKVGSQIKDLAGKIVDDGFGSTVGALAGVGATAYAAKKLGMVGGLGVGALIAQYGQGYAFGKGIAYNPRMAVLFDSVQFREFGFSYRLIARNEEESDQITEIVRAFQNYMLPAYAPDLEGQSAFTYPLEFGIEFSQQLQKHLFQFKPCVLKNVSVSYNGENGPAFFDGTDAPVIVDIQLQFQETKLLVRDAIEDEQAATSSRVQTQAYKATGDDSAMFKDVETRLAP